MNFVNLLIVSVLLSGVDAFAWGQRVSSTVISESKISAADLLSSKIEKFECAATGHWASRYGVERTVELPAVDAQDFKQAAQLAVTPFIVDEELLLDQWMRIKIQNAVFLVRSVNCKQK